MIISPALILIFGGLLLPLLPKTLRLITVVILPIITLSLIFNISGNTETSLRFALLFNLQLLHIHPFTYIFATAFCIAAIAGGLFSLHRDNPLEMSATMIYAGSAVGITFSGDLITLFIYWEIMAIASTMVILCGEGAAARRAALRYALMHFVGGAILLAGITAHIIAFNSTTFVPMIGDLVGLISGENTSLSNISAVLIMLGVLVNAAAPPFSAWLPDAYPEGSPVGSVFLSAFTTKAAVFVLLTLFAGTQILIYIGLFMIFYGIIYAMLENDIRRILSYSIINQVGFMVAGIGIGSQLALAGVAAHAFCHIIYKGLLFMSAGSVLMMTGKRRCSELGGLYRSMKLTTICGVIGALSISAFPLTSGFVSKAMILTSSADANMMIVWFLLIAASAGVFLHAGIKFPWFVFFQKDSGLRPADPPVNMRVAMLLMAALCIIFGIFPQYLYMLLPVNPDYVPYTGEHVITQLQLLLFAGLAFFIMLPMLKRTSTISLDFDWLYRIFLRNIIFIVEQLLNTVALSISNYVKGLFKVMHKNIYKWHGAEGILSRSWSLGNTVLCTTALLGVFLILYYVKG